MLWLKALHIVAVVTWFAGLFYLPRLLIYHTEATEPVVRERLGVMARRLRVMTDIGAALTLVFGLATLWWWIAHVPDFFRTSHWLHAKLVLVLGLYAYHGMLLSLTRRCLAGENPRSPRWLRLFNEVPALLLLGIVILVVVKPF